MVSDGQVIPAGCRVIMATYAIHHNEKYYPNPDEWNPHNFDADRVAERHPYSFLPFGFGLRTCLGRGELVFSISYNC